MTFSDGLDRPLPHGGDLAAARRLFPGAPQPFIDLSTGINPHSYRPPHFQAELLACLPDPAKTAELAAIAARAYGAPSAACVVPAPGTPTGLAILVAEDNDINALLARALLTKLGHRPTMAADGAAAVESFLAARAAGTPYDRVLMDQHMPGMDGIEATRRIRSIEAEQKAPRTPILALTANASAEDRDACLGAGMDGFLVKPLDRERLSAALAGGSDAALAA